MALPRVPTGIDGFDQLCQGGLIRNRSYVVEGVCGGGKSLFALQFLYNGATKYNEPGILLATEERPSLIRENAANFGWDLKKLEDEHRFVIIDGSSTKIGVPSTERFVDVRPFDVDSIIDQIISIQEETQAKRAVVDSTTAIGYMLNDASRFRLELLKMSTTLEMLELTTVMTAEAQRVGADTARTFGIESFVAEGLVSMHFKRQESLRVRGIEIHKMRGSEHSHKIHPFDITNRGIVVHPEDELYGEF
ncbi:MAG: circadian clock protein KaiC [Euryarchaeota archaeon]|nr:circadian clock protein KaiC [Euryarchaeota archaeon]